MTSEWSQKIHCIGGKVILLSSQETKCYRFFSKLIKITSDQRRPLENPDYRQEGKEKKSYKTGDMTWSLYMRTALIPDGAWKILLTTGITCLIIICYPFIWHRWRLFYSLVMQFKQSYKVDRCLFVCSNIKQRTIFSWFLYSTHSIPVLICMRHFKFCILSEQKNQPWVKSRKKHW